MLKRSFLKRKPLKRKKKEPLSEEEIEKITQQNTLFLSIWRKRPHISEISGEKIYTYSSLNFHHIFKKENHRELANNEENIILILPTEHANVELNKYRYEEINRRRELLKKKYNIQ